MDETGPHGLPTGTAQRQMGGLSFDPEGADFTAWINQWKNEVYRNWIVPQPAMLGFRGHVDFEFTVERDGKVSSIRLLKSAGQPALDRAAENALRGGQFLPLPSDYRPPRLTITVSFYYNEGPAQVVSRAPRTGNAGAAVAAALAVGMGLAVACRTMPVRPSASPLRSFSVEALVPEPRVRVGIVVDAARVSIAADSGVVGWLSSGGASRRALAAPTLDFAASDGPSRRPGLADRGGRRRRLSSRPKSRETRSGSTACPTVGSSRCVVATTR